MYIYIYIYIYHPRVAARTWWNWWESKVEFDFRRHDRIDVKLWMADSVGDALDSDSLDARENADLIKALCVGVADSLKDVEWAAEGLYSIDSVLVCGWALAGWRLASAVGDRTHTHTNIYICIYTCSRESRDRAQSLGRLNTISLSKAYCILKATYVKAIVV